MTHKCPDRLVFLGQNLDNIVAEELSAYLFLLDAQNRADIHFYIDCSRGSLAAGMTIFDAMQLVEAHISTLCLGEASTITGLILAAGTKGKRIIHPSARISLLPITTWFDSYNENKVARANEISQMNESLAFLLAQATGQAKATIHTDLETGLCLDATEAIRYGLADIVSDAFLPVTQ